MREVYLDVPGSSVWDLLAHPGFPDEPDEVGFIEAFDAPANVGDNYGQRLRAYLVPPQTGSYRFWITCDDTSVLYVSTDDTEANKVEIANVPGWAHVGEWDRYSAQRSSLVSLVAGQRYYIEVLMKEGPGGDHLAVRWRLPDGTIEEPIGANRIEAYGLGPPNIYDQPDSVSVPEGGEARFWVRLDQGFGAGYQWQRNGVDIPGATDSEYAVSPALVPDDQSEYRCVITNSLGGIVSDTATLTVVPDTDPPTILAASTLTDPDRITVVFSEPVDEATSLRIGSYTISGGVSILSIRSAGTPSSVVLETSGLALGGSYQLSISDVQDLAYSPNAIVPNSTATVAYEIVPLEMGRVRATPEPLGPSRRRSGLIISEIMYNPAPRSDGLVGEYVELYNAGEAEVDLGGYRLSGDIDYTLPAGTSLLPGHFLVCAPVPADVESLYGQSGVLGGFESRLDNGGGLLRLRNRSGAILCEVAFEDDPPWPVAADGGGHSLVLARPSYGEDDVRAWGASALAGGSPGEIEPESPVAYTTVMINEVLSHTDDPLVDYVELFNYGLSPVDLDGCILTDDPASNRYLFAGGTQIPGSGYIVVDQTELGFALSAGGETLYLKVPDGSRIVDAVRFGPQAQGISWGRFPDGGESFAELEGRTPADANAIPLVRAAVINELMYHPPSGEREDEFVELHETSGSPVDLGGWRLGGGVEYYFPAGTILPANGYLVIARDRMRLLTNYPGLSPDSVVGDYRGSLADGGEAIRLEMPEDLVSIRNTVPVTNTVYIVADEVRYGDDARWGKWADGGGSSLELIDARADNGLAANWADSDESTKGDWVQVEHTGLLDLGNGAIDELHVLLLGAGQCLVDEVEVVSGGGGNRVPNGRFDAGLEGWVMQGNHVASKASAVGVGHAGSQALQVVASGGGDNGANRLETDLTSSLSSGTTATLRARARWLRGHPDLLLRLKGNHLEAVGHLPIPTDLGTPGQPNSRSVPNAGPSIEHVSHVPVLPGHLEPVTILARVQDPDGLARLQVRYRLDPSDQEHVAPMYYRGAGVFAAELPGQPGNTLLAFRVEAADDAPVIATSTFPVVGPECLIRYGESTPPGSLGVYRMWMTQANLDTWAGREKLSNEALDGTFVLGDYRVIYNAGARYRGSPFIRRNYSHPTGGLCAYLWKLPEHEPLLASDELNLDTLEPSRDDTRQRERTSFWIADQLGLPFTHQRYVRLVFNGQQRGEVYSDSQQPNSDYVESWFPNDDRGDIFKVDDWFEFDDSFGFSYQTARLQKYTTTGGIMKKARYRWNWEKKSNRGLDDDYSRLFDLVDALNTDAPNTDPYLAAVQNLIDVEQWMRIFAARRIVGDWDGYSYQRGKNQFAYKPEVDRWKMLLWDLDFALRDNNDPYQGLFADVEDPTIQGMYSTPALVRAYWRAMYDAAYGPLLAHEVGPVMDAWYDVLTDNGISAAHPGGVANWIDQRRSFIAGELAGMNVPLSISSNGGANFSTDDNLVTLTGTAPVVARDLVINGVPFPVRWVSVLEWEVQLALGPGANNLQFTGIDSFGNPIPRLLDSITVTYTGPGEDPADYLVINEIMYNPAQPDAAFVEIHNPSAITTFDLTGYRLDGADFEFAPGTVIAPGGFLVIANDLVAYRVAYGTTSAVTGVMDGRLDNGGETLRLIQQGITPELDVIVDEVHYEDDPPWPGDADGFGPSLQLIDPTQDNNRVGNWTAIPGNSGGGGTNVVVEFSDLWRYHDQGQDLGTRWRETTYDDDGWLEGAGLLAYESASLPEPIRTVLSHGATTYYFRHTFSLPGDPAATTLWLDMIIDDGAVFYLNGTEVWRQGVDDNAIVTYQTFANRTVNNANREGSFLIPTEALRAGDNVLAVELHNTNSTSSDEVFGVRLTAVTAAAVSFTPGAANQVGEVPHLPSLWLNEIQPGNSSGPQDGAGERDPWVELYNSGPTVIQLDPFRLSPDFGVTSWSFPAGATLGPGEFLMVWVDGQSHQTTGSEYHTSFDLPRYEGAIALMDASHSPGVVDYLLYGVLLDDQSRGAWPDGTPAKRRPFYGATPGETNNPAYPVTPVAINEWMSDNRSTVFDPADGVAEDWFELVNLGPDPVDLSGFFLTDDLTEPDQWRIPEGTMLDPAGFLLIWADNETNQNQAGQLDLHAGFKLSREGEELGLFAPNLDPIDTRSFPAQAEDQSHGSWPDGDPQVVVLDPITPGTSNLVDTNANLAPVIGTVSRQRVTEQTELRVTLSATDGNIGQELTFDLQAEAPAGVSLNPQSGVLIWIPTEEQGPGTYSFTASVTDNGSPPLTDDTLLVVDVDESNQPPSLPSLGDQQGDENVLYQFQAVAVDPDVPAQLIRYSLLPGAPAGASIDTNTGVFSWMPGESDGPGAVDVTVVATDNGVPPLNVAATITLTVDEVNGSPVVDPIAPQQAWANTLFSLQASAQDTDQPPNSLRFDLGTAPPPGAAMDPDTGLFSWAPAATYTGQLQRVTIRVTDDGTPPRTATRSFDIDVGTLKILRVTGFELVDSQTLHLDWEVDPDGENRLQFSGDLGVEPWSALGGGVSPPVLVPIGPATNRAYRVVTPP